MYGGSLICDKGPIIQPLLRKDKLMFPKRLRTGTNSKSCRLSLSHVVTHSRFFFSLEQNCNGFLVITWLCIYSHVSLVEDILLNAINSPLPPPPEKKLTRNQNKVTANGVDRAKIYSHVSRNFAGSLENP